MSGGTRRGRRRADPARRLAYTVLLAVETRGSYTNLALVEQLRAEGMSGRDAAFATELVDGTARGTGTWDAVIAEASGRDPARLQAGVRVVLRMACHQILAMRVPTRAAVASSVDLAGQVIGERVTGLVNAVSRRIASHDLDGWAALISPDDELTALALATLHPRWIVDAMAERLGPDELEAALRADNEPPVPTLVVRPGLADRQELLDAGGEPTRYSPWGATRRGNPADVPAVKQGRAGVQDEGSQLVTRALVAAARPSPGQCWLDLCAGPGGKAALLACLAARDEVGLVACELHPHRAEMVAAALAPVPGHHEVITADATNPPLSAESFDAVLADVPCSGLGSLRRRPESRWRRRPSDIDDLVVTQKRLLTSAVRLTRLGGVVGYVTCSPHRAETIDVITDAVDRLPVHLLDAPSMLPEVPGAASPENPLTIQLWPHRHGTDAMFCALLRREEGTVPHDPPGGSDEATRPDDTDRAHQGRNQS